MSSDEGAAEADEVMKTARRMLRAAHRRSGVVAPFAVLLITRNRITGATLPRPCLFVLHPEPQHALLEQLHSTAAKLAATVVCLAMFADVDGHPSAVIVAETPAGMRIAEAAQVVGGRLGPMRSVLPHLVDVGRLMQTRVL